MGKLMNVLQKQLKSPEHKKDAEDFSIFWERKISRNELVYTRTPEGRLELLKARKSSLNPDFHPEAERVSAWR